MLDIIGAGFARTGTGSLKAALERLGYGPCHHMRELFESPRQTALWSAVADGGPVDWSEVYAGYRATTDLPGAAYWRELAAARPTAKVILTVRDPQRWYASVRDNIHPSAQGDAALDGRHDVLPHLRDLEETVRKIVWDGFFAGEFTDEARAIRAFEEHNAAVRREVDPERLLVFEVAQGWEPLCSFLGVEIPDEPFPHENDSATFREMVAARFAELRATGTSEATGAGEATAER
ncbi:sulfotransferase family protein [Streptomyces oceani]|uniref:Sulfotransferase family protein n=1 Tax=Streptomyces oceani TaxID=1075402 RepID=A0A1E7KMI8_9ACTN|nr:sulfotransferase family protein [Streptomyces oceani]OEV05192.1 hypothetical protein AN216_04260 [Streptomyces oceani]